MSVSKFTKQKRLVRDGFLNDLPEELQSKVMEIHKLIVSETRNVASYKNYEDIKDVAWSKSMLDEFLRAPKANDEVGSVRVYKKGKRFSCMIQMTSHVMNNRDDIDHELFHDLIRTVHQNIRPRIRKKYDLTLTCESSHGERYEGFDVWTKQNIAKTLWEKFEDKTTKNIVEIKESAEEFYNETSHGKLKYDFRTGYDVNTGHALKIVYSLDNIKVHPVDKIEGNPERASEIEKTIAKVGNMDHSSSGQKVLAIVDRVTGNKLDHATVIGPHSVSTGIQLELDDEFVDYLHKKMNDENFRKNLTANVKVGEVDSKPLFKTTFWPKHDKGIKKLRGGATIDVDMSRDYGVPFEYLSRGRGAKLNDMDNKKTMSYPVFKHPSKKDIKQNPELYKKDETKTESYYEFDDNDISIIKFKNLPYGLQNKILEARSMIEKSVTCESKDFGDLCIQKHGDIYEGSISLLEDAKLTEAIADKICDSYMMNSADTTKSLCITESEVRFDLDPEYVKKLFEYFENHDPSEENIFTESNDDGSATYNVNMSEKEAKRTLRSLSQDIINKTKENTKYQIVQYIANIYANIITKNLLPLWAKGFRKFTITLDSYKSPNVFEFKIPTMTQDFVSRFVDGRESLNGFIHRKGEINVKMSPQIFHTMEHPDDAFNFFKAAIKYYDNGLVPAGEKLMGAVMKSNRELKHLISTTKLSGIVTLPIQLLFIFDDVKMNDKNAFKIDKETISTVNSFVKQIYTKYAAPEKEKKQILDDMKNIVMELREYCEPSDNMRHLSYLVESIDSYYNDAYKDQLSEFNESWYKEQCDEKWITEQKDMEIVALQERWGVKKLKKIPADLVAYISIETEAIKDANDKMMIASYCISKLEIVEWYIELLEVGSKKYIVPHTLSYLQNVRTQLLQCYENIMKTPIPKVDRPLIQINDWPAGYEG